MKSVKDIILKLVAVQSDTGTALEANLAKEIYNIIKEDDYFKQNPDLCGLIDVDDIFDRPVVWALKKGKSDKTIILSGHYDAVEIDCYGALKEYALNPDVLKEKLKEIEVTTPGLKEDIEDENWMFGRGVADMKGGIAINLYTLFNNKNEDVNILFTSISDEENISAGTRAAMPIYKELQEKFNLDYKLCVISEPQFRDGPYNIYSGGAGKILPMIVAKGKLAHCASVLEGLNATSLIAEISRNIELNSDLSTSDLGMSVQPPTVQFMGDLKTTYDVSIPEYAYASVNVLFLNGKNSLEILNKIKAICEKSFENVIERYNASFDRVEAIGNDLGTQRQAFKPVVMGVKELEEKVKATVENYDEFIANLEADIQQKVNSAEMTLQKASVYYVKSFIEACKVDYPIVVVGIAPPYYPSVSNVHNEKDISGYIQNIKDSFAALGEAAIEPPYLAGMADISYMSCQNAKAEREVLDNLTIPKKMYDIPFEVIEELNLPTIMLGPTCRDVHQWTERVYIPDLVDIMPKVFDNLVNNI